MAKTPDEYDRLNLSLDQGLKDLFKTACALRGEKMTKVVSGWIRAYVSAAFKDRGLPDPLAAPPPRPRPKR